MACTWAASTSVDARDDLFRRKELPKVDLLPRQVGHARIRAFQPHQDVSLKLVLGPLQLFVGKRLFLQLAELPRISSIVSSAFPAEVPA